MKLPSLKIGKWTAKLPLVQGGMAIRISLSKLAGTVAREGGIGLIAATGLSMDELREEIRKARKIAPQGIVGINIMVAASSFAETVHTAMDEKIDLVVAGAGFSRDIFEWGRRSDTPIVPIVSSVKLAKIAQKLGATALVVEGGEAGGHLGTDRSVKELVPAVKAAVSIPVIGAGGIVNGKDMAEMLQLGADGVQIGSRFAATEESSASQAMKEAYIRCKDPDDIIIIHSSVGFPGQAIRNKFSESVLNDTVPKPTVCTNCLKRCSRRFCLSQALIRAQQGDGVDGLIFAGTNMLRIHEILPAAKVVQSICSEAERILARQSWRVMLPNVSDWTGRLRHVSGIRVAKYREALPAKRYGEMSQAVRERVVRKASESMREWRHWQEEVIGGERLETIRDSVSMRMSVKSLSSKVRRWKRVNSGRYMKHGFAGRQGVMLCKGV